MMGARPRSSEGAGKTPDPGRPLTAEPPPTAERLTGFRWQRWGWPTLLGLGLVGFLWVWRKRPRPPRRTG